MSETIEINGELYQKKVVEDLKPSKLLNTVLLSSMMLGAADNDMTLDEGKKAPMPAVDIVEEYKLIQQKKSKLSANQRKWVISVFENTYTKILNP